ncbi:MAG: acetyl-CoA carboxylase, biotin carboxyl carrier protein [Flavobacteriia bacterium]|nr:MAG: acetyl-CoA carboxylase, biotin carboxyl carrier protein [Flavobacteriia bacterium]
MELKEIQNLIKFVAKSGANEVKLETEDFKITIKTGSGKEETTIIHQQAPVAQVIPDAGQTVVQNVPVAQTQAEAPKETPEEKDNYVTIKSPIIGTFYRRPSPDKAPFVKVGDEINVGDTVCIIEAMKLFNEVESEISGKIVKILIEDASPVEFDQPLFLVDPS